MKITHLIFISSFILVLLVSWTLFWLISCFGYWEQVRYFGIIQDKPEDRIMILTILISYIVLSLAIAGIVYKETCNKFRIKNYL